MSINDRMDNILRQYGRADERGKLQIEAHWLAVLAVTFDEEEGTFARAVLDEVESLS